METIRDAPLGQVIRFLTKNKVFKYPEEEDNFECPQSYSSDLAKASIDSTPAEEKSSLPLPTDSQRNDVEKANPEAPLSRASSSSSSSNSIASAERAVTRHDTQAANMRAALTRTRTRESTRAYTRERYEVEQEEAIEKKQTRPIEPMKTADGDILVDWYTTDDPANPQNWSSWKKFYVGFQIL
jgi:MFS transporter, DHA1 family, multidrug resistance protein